MGGESWHIHGNAEHVGFGVAMRNGYAEPWAYGYMPNRSLGDNALVVGAATWQGHLLGFTPSAESVDGDASLRVDLETLEGELEFSNLEFEFPRMPPSIAQPSMPWKEGTLSYDVQVMRNTFKRTGGDAGIVTGAFFGGNHEGMGGTLQRYDLTAAFGGSR